MRARFRFILPFVALFAGGCARREVHLPPPPPKKPPVITLAAVGDVLLVNNPVSNSSRPVSAFEAIKPALSKADIAFCNLECPLSSKGRPAEKEYVFRASPEQAAELRAAGIDIVSLANNHTLDYGREALLDTLEALRAQGLSWVGAGENLHRARQPRFFTFGSDKTTETRVAFLAYSNMLPRESYARATQSGTAPALPSLIREDVGRVSKKADFTIVAFHWGKECSQIPRWGQRTLGRLAIDSGADLVLGSHPHVLQGIECYHSGIIAYSLGNFVFPSRGRARESAILQVRMMRPRHLRLEVLPVWIENSTPRLAKGAQAAALLQRLARLSARLGTRLEIRGDSAFLRNKAESPPTSAP